MTKRRQTLILFIAVLCWTTAFAAPAQGQESPWDMKRAVVETLEACLPTGDKDVDKGIEKAVEKIEKSLGEDLWVDAWHLDPKKGDKVFKEEEKAAKELEKLLKDEGLDEELAAKLMWAKMKLVEIDRMLAWAALEEARRACPAETPEEPEGPEVVEPEGKPSKCEKELEKASEDWEKALEEFEEGDCEKAIKHFGKAWEHAQKAIKESGEEPEEEPEEEMPPALSKAEEAGLPDVFALEGNYPNPFNPQTTIAYALPEAVRVRVRVYNPLGQEVARLVDGFQEAGRYTVAFDATHLSSGAYVYTLEAGPQKLTRLMVLVK